MHNFTVADTLGTLKASVVLFPFMSAPGYVAGWILNLFEFRRRRLILRLILAVPLSIAICPMLSYLLARFLETGLWVFYITVSAASVWLLAKEVRITKLWTLSRNTWLAVGSAATWIAVALSSVVDLQIGQQLYPPIVAYDHSVRTALTVAIARQVPPNNPFFANAVAPLRYHYLWLLFCSLPMRLLHLSPRWVVNAGVVWCGLGLMCLIAISLKFLVGVRNDIERQTMLAVALLYVTGLDILPTLYLGVARHLWLSDMEWWNDPQITSWIGSLLWVPHHVAAMITCLVGFLLLRYQRDRRGKWGTAPVLIAGMAFASAAGMSVYVTFTFVIAVALWLLALVARKDWVEALMFVGAGAVAFLWALPFLIGLRSPGSGDAFVEVTLRPFPAGLFLVHELGFHLQTQFSLSIANAILLPFNYAMELGFFFLIGLLRLRQLIRGQVAATANELAAWTLVLTSFLIGTFLESSTIATNDLGWRCFLPAQLILLLWATTMLHDWFFHGRSTLPESAPRPWLRAMLVTLMVLGIFGTAYQVSMLRMFPLFFDRGMISGQSWIDPDRQFGKRAYALRSAYEVLDAELLPSAVLQSSPDTKDPILHMLYSGRDAAAANGECGIAFGGDADVCAERMQKLGRLFGAKGLNADTANLDAVCREYGVDALVVEAADPVWNEPTSWVWSRKPAVANNYVRAFRCGAAEDGAHR